MTCTYLELALLSVVFFFSSMMIVAPCFDAERLSILLSQSLMVSVQAKHLPLYAYTSFVSDLVLAKLGAVSKRLGKLHCSLNY